MTSQVLSLTRLEWFKLRHRRMPWILLLLSVLLVQITFWGAYAVFRAGADVTLGDGGGTASVGGDFLDILAFPNIAVIGLAVSHGFGIILIMILAASLTGTEYGWGTVRTVLTRGARTLAVVGLEAHSRCALGRRRAGRRNRLPGHQ